MSIEHDHRLAHIGINDINRNQQQECTSCS